MVSKPTTREMSDKHERFLAEIFDGRMSKGSGNQFRDQMDGRNNREQAYGLAWDGKSTQGKTVTVSRLGWAKAVEQAVGERPVMPIRFYGSGYELTTDLDLVVIDLNDFVEILEAARKYEKVKACLETGHVTSGKKDDPNVCAECGHQVGWEA